MMSAIDAPEASSQAGGGPTAASAGTIAATISATRKLGNVTTTEEPEFEFEFDSQRERAPFRGAESQDQHHPLTIIV